jgi:hypothetical protein
MMMKKSAIAIFAIAWLAAGTLSGAEPIKLNYSRLLAPQSPISSLSLAAMDEGDKTFLDMSQQDDGSKKISMKKAMALSLLFPGAGQYYAGAEFKGQVFMGVELAIWTGFIAYRVYGGWKVDNYRDYAAAHAGVDNSGKDDEFYDWVGFYNNRDEFNQFGRLYYPDRPYLPDNSYYYWQWDSEENREVFRQLKDGSKTAYRNSTFFIGLAIVNRLIAGIDTYRTVKSANAKTQSLTQVGDYKFTLSPDIMGENPAVKFSISRKF